MHKRFVFVFLFVCLYVNLLCLSFCILGLAREYAFSGLHNRSAATRLEDKGKAASKCHLRRSTINIPFIATCCSNRCNPSYDVVLVCLVPRCTPELVRMWRTILETISVSEVLINLCSVCLSILDSTRNTIWNHPWNFVLASTFVEEVLAQRTKGFVYHLFSTEI